MSKRKSTEVDSGHPKKHGGQGHWALGLLSAMDDPNLQVHADGKVVVIKDKFPKSKYHYLVMPRKKISKLADLKQSDLELLKHMQFVGLQLTEKHPGYDFRLGYHAEPSMHHLHMHVLSDDFDSPCLKTKKHWNSFTTDHFIPSEDVIKNLTKIGKPSPLSSFDCQQLLKSDLRCHKCNFSPKTMPQLKLHLLSHLNKDLL